MVSPTPFTDLYGSGNSNATPSASGVPANAFGTKPAAVNPSVTAGPAVSTAMNLGNQVFSQLPGYGTDIGNIGANITSETAGQLPADVVTQITNEAAARGVGAGTGAATVNQNLLRTLGLTSLDLTQMGQRGLDTQLGLLPGAGLYQNPAFYPSSAQTLEAQQQNALNAAAPDPFAAGNASIRAAAGGFAAGRGSGTELPTAPSGTSTVVTPTFPGSTGGFSQGILADPNQAILNEILSTYGNMQGWSGGGGNDTSVAVDEAGNPTTPQTGPGASETAVSPDEFEMLYTQE